ncbi:hypothetical protein COW06_00820 [Candidatus Gracilibacteria bacterium CG12_big_fil_rev_8_21_14_0_65_38_15]|nr:MAG: hypothetical protein COW68_03745 [Candidatus Gracilibacteria bacterium CG18_big_fil_WC_8_21_14_2_50_38_16]PIQ42034.1 MAG: hypothetical protein COW06_00820 [Candidatus Gracilibacteria bacterium CG12_big_fil_rev_8_21_14_0_65_38_15]
MQNTILQNGDFLLSGSELLELFVRILPRMSQLNTDYHTNMPGQGKNDVIRMIQGYYDLEPLRKQIQS